MRTCWMPSCCHSATAASASGPPESSTRSSAIPTSGPAARAGAASTSSRRRARSGRIARSNSGRAPEVALIIDTMATTDVSEREARQVAEAAREQDWKLPSFGKELFLGNYRLDLIHPQPRLDAEATEKGERFLATLRQFLETEVDPLRIERDSKIPDEVVEGFKRIGAMGMKVAEEYGGLGLSQVYYNRALAMVGVWHGALGALVSAHQLIGVAEPLRMFGTDEQKREWLPRVARTDISAFLLTEPDVGSDPARVATSAEPVDGGYVLNGTKLWATNGVIADVVVVMARVPKSEGHKGGISAFILAYD